MEASIEVELEDIRALLFSSAEQLESIGRYSAKYQRSQTELDTRLLANESSRLINSLITLNCIAEEKIRKIVEEINKEVTEK